MAEKSNTIWYVLGAGAVAALGYGIYRSRKKKATSKPSTNGQQPQVKTYPAPNGLTQGTFAAERLRAAKRREKHFVLIDDAGKEQCFETATGKPADIKECLKEGVPGLLEGIGGSLGHDGLGSLGGAF